MSGILINKAPAQLWTNTEQNLFHKAEVLNAE